MSDKEELEVVVTLKDQASPKAQQTGRELSSGLSTLGNIAMGGVAIAATAAVAGIGAVGVGLNFAIQEAMEAQNGLAQLDAVLKATGGTSGMTRDGIISLADSLAQVVTATDDEIIAGETVLLQFKNIGKDVFPQATQTALDLATRLGTDMPTAAKLLGKALETPGEGLLRLKQAGVAFTDEQTDMVKKMVESGDAAGAQTFIMDALAKSVGGAAQAAGETMTGQWTIMKNSLANTAEEVGTAIMPALTEAFNSVKPYIMDLAKAVSDFVKSPEFKQWVQDAIKWLKTDLPPILKEIGRLFTEVVVPAFQAIGKILQDMKPAMIWFYEHWLKGLPVAIDAAKVGWLLFTKGIELALTPITNIINGIKTLVGYFNDLKKMLSDLKLPDWLTPGSPTPLEIGIRGINDAMGGLSTRALPGVSAGLSRIPATVGGGGAGTVVINFNSPVMGFANEYDLANKLAPIIQAQIKGVR